MGRFKVTYPRQRDAASEARSQAVSQATQQRQAQASAYAAARFNEWAAGAQQREQTAQLRIQNLQAESELKGAQFKYGLWKDNELRRQTTAYYTAMPALQEQLKQAGIYPGSQRYAAEMSAFAAEIPDAVTHNEAIRKELMDFSKVDATATQISNAAKTLQEGLAGAGLRGTSFSSTKEGNFDVKATRSVGGNPEEDLFKAHKITPTQFNSVPPEALQLGNVDASGNFNPDLQGQMIQFPAGVNDKGAARTIRMSVPEFNERKLEFSQQQAPTEPQAVAQPAAPVQPQTTNQPAPKHLGRFNPDTGEFE